MGPDRRQNAFRLIVRQPDSLHKDYDIYRIYNALIRIFAGSSVKKFRGN